MIAAVPRSLAPARRRAERGKLGTGCDGCAPRETGPGGEAVSGRGGIGELGPQPGRAPVSTKKDKCSQSTPRGLMAPVRQITGGLRCPAARCQQARFRDGHMSAQREEGTVSRWSGGGKRARSLGVSASFGNSSSDPG